MPPDTITWAVTFAVIITLTGSRKATQSDIRETIKMFSHRVAELRVFERGCLAGFVTLVLAAGLASLTASVAAQQASTKKGASPPAATSPPESQNVWVKLCEKAPATVEDKTGKEVMKDLSICLTHHERLDGNTGMTVVSVGIRQIEGHDKPTFMVMVPLGMVITPGMRAMLYSKDAWELTQKNEKVDDSKLKEMKLDYTLCHPAGCTAEIEARPELINDLKSSGGIIVFAIKADGTTVGFPVPLAGFEKSFMGSPVDSKKYTDARRALLQQIAQRQQELVEQQTKQIDQQKGTTAPPRK